MTVGQFIEMLDTDIDFEIAVYDRHGDCIYEETLSTLYDDADYVARLPFYDEKGYRTAMGTRFNKVEISNNTISFYYNIQ